MKTYDPAGHIKISLYNYAQSRGFYQKLFDILSYEMIKNTPASATWVSPFGFGITITPSTGKLQPLPHGAPGIHHLCLKAPSPDTVDDVTNWLFDYNVEIVEGPALYPQYTSGYYAVFFKDLDGIKLEVAYY